MTIIYYAYDADLHCIGCTKALSDICDPVCPSYDEHGVSYRAHDGEGNFVSPVFSTDEILDDCTHCGTCGGEL